MAINLDLNFVQPTLVMLFVLSSNRKGSLSLGLAMCDHIQVFADSPEVLLEKKWACKLNVKLITYTSWIIHSFIFFKLYNALLIHHYCGFC